MGGINHQKWGSFFFVFPNYFFISQITIHVTLPVAKKKRTLQEDLLEAFDQRAAAASTYAASTMEMYIQLLYGYYMRIICLLYIRIYIYIHSSCSHGYMMLYYM